MSKNILVVETGGTDRIVWGVDEVQMDGALILSKDGEVIAAWAAGAWDRWQVKA